MMITNVATEQNPALVTNQVADINTNTTQDLASVLPTVVAQAMKTHKWVTVIGASREQIESLAEQGISRGRIRWIQGKDNDQREWATEQAILAGTSGVVISWLEAVSPRTQQRITMASRVSQTTSFIFSELTLRTPLH